VSEAAVAGAAVVDPLRELAAEMRARGARVGAGELLCAHRALAAVNPLARSDARLALRAAICSSREDLERFEQAFSSVFGGRRWLGGAPEPLSELGAVARAVLPRAGIPASASRPALDDPSEPGVVPAAWSDVELLRSLDFASYDDLAVARVRPFLARLARRGPMRLSRRSRASARHGHAPDLRRIVRA
jgi:uncharacterized protein with von Willebrand factor type A (vWA) domain